MKTVNTDEENIQIFRTTWEISMEFSGKKGSYDKIKSHKKDMAFPSL